MTLNFKVDKRDLDRVELNQQAKYQGQRSFFSKVIVRTHRHTDPTDCFIWTTKVVLNLFFTYVDDYNGEKIFRCIA